MISSEREIVMNENISRALVSEDEARKKLKTILLERSYKEGIFTLSSGKTSDFYIDCRVTVLDGEGAFLTGIAFSKMITREFPEAVAVAGMTMGGDPLVTATSICSYLDSECNDLEALIIRKEPKGHGTNNYIEGKENVPVGSPIIIMDDVATTSGTLIMSKKRIESEGYIVAGVIVVVDRQEGASEALKESTGFTLNSIFTREQLLA